MVEAMDPFQPVRARTPHSIRTLPAVVLGMLLLSGSVFAAGPILLAPDRRAIPQLVTREQTEIRYGTGVVVGAETILTAPHAVAVPRGGVFANSRGRRRVRCRAAYHAPASDRARQPA